MKWFCTSFILCVLSQSFVFAQSTIECNGSEFEGVLYKVSEEMPSIKGCEEKSELSEINKCTKLTMDDFLQNHVSYKDIIASNNPRGSMYLTFIVEANGCLSNFNVRRDICNGCGEAVVDILKTSPPWNPGKSKGEPVRVMQNMTFLFQQSE